MAMALMDDQRQANADARSSITSNLGKLLGALHWEIAGQRDGQRLLFDGSRDPQSAPPLAENARGLDNLASAAMDFIPPATHQEISSARLNALMRAETDGWSAFVPGEDPPNRDPAGDALRL